MELWFFWPPPTFCDNMEMAIKIKILKALSQGWSLWKWVYVSSLNSEVQTKTTPTISILFAQARLLGSARPLPADWGFFGLDMSTTYFYLNWLLRQQSLPLLAVLCDFSKISDISCLLLFFLVLWRIFFYCFGPIICYGRSFTELLIHRLYCDSNCNCTNDATKCWGSWDEQIVTKQNKQTDSTK